MKGDSGPAGEPSLGLCSQGQGRNLAGSLHSDPSRNPFASSPKLKKTSTSFCRRVEVPPGRWPGGQASPGPASRSQEAAARALGSSQRSGPLSGVNCLLTVLPPAAHFSRTRQRCPRGGFALQRHGLARSLRRRKRGWKPQRSVGGSAGPRDRGAAPLPQPSSAVRTPLGHCAGAWC